MAIVPNKDGMGIWSGNYFLGSVDVSLCTPTRSTGANPNGVLTPAFIGEIVIVTADGSMFRAYGLANNMWAWITT